MILLAQGAKTRLVNCHGQSCMHLICWQVKKLCFTIYVTVYKYKTQVIILECFFFIILEWFANSYYFWEISLIPLIDYIRRVQNIQWKKYNSSNIFQFLPEESRRNSYLPVSSGCPGRNTFLPEEKQLVLPIDIENPYRLSNCLYR